MLMLRSFFENAAKLPKVYENKPKKLHGLSVIATRKHAPNLLTMSKIRS